MDDYVEVVGPLFVDAEELDVWFSGLRERVRGYSLDRGLSKSEAKTVCNIIRSILVCLSDNISHTFTTDTGSTAGTKNVCRLTVDVVGLCIDTALTTLELEGGRESHVDPLVNGF